VIKRAVQILPIRAVCPTGGLGSSFKAAFFSVSDTGNDKLTMPRSSLAATLLLLDYFQLRATLRR
jgi:hypothetical protein